MNEPQTGGAESPVGSEAEPRSEWRYALGVVVALLGLLAVGALVWVTIRSFL